MAKLVPIIVRLSTSEAKSEIASLKREFKSLNDLTVKQTSRNFGGNFDTRQMQDFIRISKETTRITEINTKTQGRLAEETARRITNAKQSELRVFEQAERHKQRITEISAKEQVQASNNAFKSQEAGKRREYQEFVRLERQKTQAAAAEARKRGNFGQTAQNVGGGMQSAGTGLTAIVTLPLVTIATLGIKAAIELDAVRQKFVGIEGSAVKANERIKQLKDFAANTKGVTEELAFDVFSQLKPLKVDESVIKKQTQALGNVGQGVDFSRNLLQIFQQGFERGDIKEAIGRMPLFEQVLGEVAQKFGAKDAKGLKELKESGKLTLDEFLLGFADAVNNNPNFANAGESIGVQLQKSLERLNNSLAPLGEKLLGVIVPAIEKLGQFAVFLSDAFSAASPSVQNFVIGIGAFAAVIGPVLVVVGTLIVGIGSLITTIGGAAAAVGGFAALGGIIAGVVVAIGLLSAGVIATIGVVYELVDAWQNGFGPIASVVAIAVGGILTAISPIIGLPILIGAVLATIYGIWTTNFGGIRDVVATAVNEISTLINNFIAQISPYIVDGVRFIQQKFAEYWNKFAPVVSDSSNQIRTFLFETWTEISRFLQENLAGITEYFRENWDSIREAIGRVMDAVVLVIRIGIAQIRGFWADHGEQIKSVAGSVWNIVKTIVASAITQIGNIIKLITRVINGDWAGAWQALKDIVRTAVSGLASILGSLLNIVWQILKGIVTRIVGIGYEIAAGLAGISKVIFGSIVQLGLFIVDSFVKTITFGFVDSDLSGTFAKWFGNETTLATAEISNSFGEVQQTISKEVQATQNIANEKPFWEEFTQNWTTGVNSSLPVIKQSSEELKKTIQDLSQNANLSPALRKNLTSELKNIEKAISSESAKIADKFKDLQQTLNKLLNDPRVSSGLKTAIQKELKTIDTNIQNATPQINQSSQILGQNITQGATNGINQNKGDVQTAVNNLSIFNPQPFFKAGWAGGLNIGLGMVAGINSKRDDMFAATVSFAKIGAAAISETIKSRSPSKVTEQLGKWFGEGFVIGIQNQGDNIAKVSKKIVKDALGEMRKEAAKAKKEFDDLLGSSFEKQNLIVSIADFQTAKSNLETLIKLRAELSLNVGQSLPSTLPQITAEIDALNEQKQGREESLRLLKEYEDAVKNYGVELTHVQKIEQLLNDPNRSLLISAETAEKLKSAAADRDRLDAAKRLDDFKKSIESSSLGEQFNLSEQNRLMQEQIRLGRELTGLEKATISQEFDLAKLETSDAFSKLSPSGQLEAIETLRIQQEITKALIADSEALKGKIDANKSYSDLLSELNGKMVETNNLTEVARVQKLLETEAYKNLAGAQKTVILNKAAEVDSYNDQIKAAEEVRQKMEAIYNGLSDSIHRVLSASVRGGFKEGLKTAFDELKNFGLSLLDTILKELSNKLAQFILKKIFGGSSSGSSGSGGGIFGGIFDSIKKLFGGGGSSSSGGGIGGFLSGLFGGGRSSAGQSNSAGSAIDSVRKFLGSGGLGSSSGGNSHEAAHSLGGGKGGGKLGLSGGLALAGMGANLIGGLIGGRVGGFISGAGSGLALGAQIGSLFGPGPGTVIGAVIGAVAGGLLSLFGGDPKRKIDKKENMPKLQEGFADAMKQLRELAADKNALFNNPDEVISKAMEIRSAIASGFGISFQSKKYRGIANQQIASKLIEADAIIKQIKEMGDAARQALETDKRLETSFAGGVYMSPGFRRQFGNFQRRNGMLAGAFTGRDSLPSMLAPGEMVLNPYQMDAVRRNAGFDAFKGAGIPNYAGGTFVAPTFSAPTISTSPSATVSSPTIVVEPQITLHLSGVVAIDNEVSAYLETSDGKKKVVKIVQDDNKFNRK